MREPSTRRGFVCATATAAAISTAPAAASASESGAWATAETPTSNAMFDATYGSDGAYAVGGGGYLLRRTDGGWATVTEDGPTGNGSDLYGIDATDDGRRIWFVGASGVIGEYDVRDGTMTDRSQPNDATSNFNDAAVSGGA